MNFRDYPADELRALSQRAGVASGAARREKRDAIVHEQIMNAAMNAQEERNQKQHRENLKTICEMCAILREMARICQAGQSHDR